MRELMWWLDYALTPVGRVFVLAMAMVPFVLLLMLATCSMALAQQIDGQSHQHNPKWAGLWIAQDFARCCGEDDCAMLPDGAVERVDGGYLVIATGEVIGIFEALGSMDGQYWRCQYNASERKGLTRCLFVPAMGM